MLQQVAQDQVDAVVVTGRFSVLHRIRVLAHLAGVRGTGDALHRRIARRLASRKLRIDLQLLTERQDSRLSFRFPFMSRRTVAPRQA
jgi:hypothetical protein